ncbi:MAG: hypothetical protein PF545_03985, partial [Elusimicrobia bacterium]|nr:hypothetical protein [Elusimicrobiota bacterium]
SFTVSGSPWTLANISTNAWTDGETYTVLTRAYDDVTNSESEGKAEAANAHDFICDRTLPQSYIRNPEIYVNEFNNLSELDRVEGTAYDAFGISKVELSVKKSLGNKYWHKGVGWSDGEEFFTTNLSAGSTYWWIDEINFDSSCEYLIKSRAYDNNTPIANDEGDPQADGVGTDSFHKTNIDLVAPDSLIEAPTDGTTLSSLAGGGITGTAEDYNSQSVITFVKIRISDITDATTEYYDLADWVASKENWHNTNLFGAGASISWDATGLNITDSIWTSGNRYRIETYSKDSATPENIETSYSTITFTYDNTAPVSGIEFPVDTDHYKAGALGQTIYGTAVDATSDVQTVELSILQKSATKWFSGTGFIDGTTTWIDVGITPGTTNWSYTDVDLKWTTDEKYVFKTKSYDDIGNESSASAPLEVVYDETVPVTTIGNPADGSTKQKNLLTTLSGTASDTAPGLVNNVKFSLKIEDYPSVGTDYHWDGSTWVWTGTYDTDLPISASYPQNTQSNTWSYGFDASMWQTGKYYVLKTWATDKATNEEAVMPTSRFRVILPATHFDVNFTFPPPYTAGSWQEVEVKALDKDENIALTYNGTIKATTKDSLGIKGHPQTEWAESDIDAGSGGDEYTFTTNDEGSYKYNSFVKFKTASVGVGTYKFLLIYDTAATTVNGEDLGIIVTPTVAERLQVVVPGETTTPGTISGKTGSPYNQTAGAGFNVDVNVTDEFWNVTAATDTVNVTTTDPNDNITEPGNIYVDGSTTTFVTMVTAGGRYVEATSGEGYNDFPESNPYNNEITVEADNPTRLQIIFPGEIPAPGTAEGKIGAPTKQPAGNDFTITIYATDSKWNVNTDTEVTAAITTTDIYDTEPTDKTLTNGEAQAILNMKTADLQTVTAVNTDSILVQDNSDMTITYGAGQNLQVILPGETAQPGEYSSSPAPESEPPFGKDGNPDSQTAGREFTVGARLVDDYWNVKVDSQVSVNLTPSNSYGDVAVNPKTINGSGNFTVTNYTAWFGASQATHTITASAGGWTSYESTEYSLIPNAGMKLQILLPGETADPGSLTGKTDAADTQIAGSTFAVTVNAVDDYWNVQKSSNPAVQITAQPDSDYSAESAKSLLSGSATFWAVLNDAEGDPWNITASTSDGDNILPDTSSDIDVSVGNPVKLQILLPGESTDPGTSDGKSENPDSQTAGTSFKVTVNCVDDKWNKVTSTNTVISLDTDSNYAELPLTQSTLGGTTSFAVILYTAEDTTLSATDNNYGMVSDTSTQFTVDAAASAQKLQVILPGETADPGEWSGAAGSASPFGKNGSPSQQTAGNQFDVTVNIVDTYFNVKASVEPGVTVDTPDDDYDSEPSTKTLTGGTTIFSIDFRTAQASSVVRAEDTDGAGNYYGITTSAGIDVIANDPAKIFLVAPGETYANGHPIGKTDNTPSGQTAGNVFTVDAYVTDLYYNTVTSISPEVAITLEDTNSTPPSNRNLASGTTTFDIILKTAGDWWVKGDDFSATYQNYTTPDITVGADSAVKLLVLLPGETSAPGETGGKTGAPDTQVAGQEFSITVRGVDNNWNMKDDGSALADVHIETDDPYDSAPAPFNDRSLSGGETKFGITLKRAATSWIRATDVDGTALLQYETAPVDVDPDIFSRLLVTLPGESLLEGSPSGKTGSASNQIAGQQFLVTVTGTDNNFNKVDTSTADINITTEDPEDGTDIDAALSSGEALEYVTIVSSGTWEIYTKPVGWAGISGSTSTPVNVGPAPASKLQILLPGESRAPGTVSGKIDTPDDQIAGVEFTLTINAVDDNWNIDTSTSFETHLTSSDGYAGIDEYPVLSGGTKEVAVTLVKASTHTFTVDDNRNPGIVASYENPDKVTVLANTATQLLSILPGENHNPGEYGGAPGASQPYGRNGAPADQTAGVNFTVTVMAVDDWFNLNTASNPVVDLHTSDTHIDDPYVTKSFASGEAAYTLAYRTQESGASIYATDQADILSTGTSNNFKVEPAAAVELQVLVPGEFQVEGSTENGKIGSPDIAYAGIPFDITVNAVDEFYNTNTNANINVFVETSDLNDADPGVAPLVNGTKVFNINMITAGNQDITAYDYETSLDTGTSATIPVQPDAAIQYQVLVPNETNEPGIGKSGEVQPQTAGAAFTVTVNACDGDWNIDTSTDIVASLTTLNDDYDTHPEDKTLTSGTTFFVVTPITAGNSFTVRATGALNSYDSSAVTINPDSPIKLQALVPGETAEPGNYSGSVNKTSPYGKTVGSTPDRQTAGDEFTVTVNVVDNYWNIVDSAPVVNLTATDTNALIPSDEALAGGTAEFDMTFKTANATWTITSAGGGYTEFMTPQINTDPKPPVKLQVLLPGETAAPGTASGKTDTPDTQVAGSIFTITVNAVDNLYNINHSTGFLVDVVTSDPYDAEPAQASLINGTANFDIVFKEANTTQTATASPADSTVSQGVSADITVDAAADDRLQVLVPGVTPVPGDVNNSGRTGTPDNQEAGT